VKIFLNGELVPEERAVVSVLDRGFLYGDGLFESMRVFAGKPFRWEQHLQRLANGLKFVRIQLPFDSAALRDAAIQLVETNQMPECLLRLTISRGIGVRGYSPKGANKPSVAMSLHPLPQSTPESLAVWRLMTSSVRLPAKEPLAQFKTCNKLPQILARIEADDAGADEALVLNTEGYVVEGASSNLFWVDGQVVCTPPLVSGILAGVTRIVVSELCRNRSLTLREANITPVALKQVQGAFVSLSSLGIAEASTLDGHTLKRSPVVQQLREDYWELVQRETV